MPECLGVTNESHEKNDWLVNERVGEMFHGWKHKELENVLKSTNMEFAIIARPITYIN